MLLVDNGRMQDTGISNKGRPSTNAKSRQNANILPQQQVQQPQQRRSPDKVQQQTMTTRHDGQHEEELLEKQDQQDGEGE